MAQAGLLHFVDTELGSASETVLYRSQDAVHIVLVALKLDDSIYDVFQRLGAGERTLLGDVSDEDDRYTAGLGKPQQ